MAKDGEIVRWEGLPGTMFEGCRTITNEEFREVIRGLNEYERKNPWVSAMTISAIESNKEISKKDKKRIIEEYVQFLKDEEG